VENSILVEKSFFKRDEEEEEKNGARRGAEPAGEGANREINW